jgi:NAD(P)-dependent dehydrogenase (short-subunit alcohol dehydrogenase family)
MPGFISTEAIDLYSPEMKERICSRNPMKRMGTPDEVASVVCFIATESACYLNGAAIPVTGGMDLLVL